MNKVYVILYDGKISQEGYSEYDDAMKYCEDRAERFADGSWRWINDDGIVYQIVEVKIV